MTMHPLHARCCLGLLACLLSLCWLRVTPGWADDKKPKPLDADQKSLPVGKEHIQKATKAVDKALAYLAKQQNPDGSWNCGLGKNNGVNGLALLSFLGRGHIPGRGRYQNVLKRGRNFLLQSQRDDGLYASPHPSQGPMYEHALSTLALIEMYGMTPGDDPQLKKSLKKAVALIQRAQSGKGGWRYQPNSRDADLSVTVMQIVALRAAQNAQMDVSKGVLDKAVGYVKGCAYKNGGFGYQTGHGPRPAVTAAGLLSLQLTGNEASDDVGKGLDYLNAQPVQWRGDHFFYMHYYAIQAQYLAGGDGWNQWHRRVRDMMLSNQSDDGSWNTPPDDNENKVNGKDKVLSTAMACLVLEIYFHFLPAYQK